MRRILLIATLLLVVLALFAACGSTSSKGLEFVSNGDGTCYVEGVGTCTDTDIVIPSKSPDGDRVTSIGNYAFSRCRGLTSITIPNSVKSIGNFAFSSCIGLTSVTIPNSVKSIGDGAFSGCSVLTAVNWNAIKCTSAGSYDNPIFQNCTNLKTIKIGENVTTIPAYAFFGCSKLESISVESGNATYHSAGNCIIETASKTLILGCKNSVIPTDGSVTNIRYAFYGCSSLTSITIPNSVTSIGSSAFWGCSGLTSITIPNSVKSIGDGAFYGCSGLTSITIPNSVTSIGDSAFLGCRGLTSITIPNSVTWIETCAFYGCSGLTSITIPNSVTSIGGSAFSYCSGLTDIYYQGTEAQWNAISKRSNWSSNTGSYTMHYNA